MQTLQISLPDPVVKRLREWAEREGRPVGEVVRLAVECGLKEASASRKLAQVSQKLPTFHGGEIQVSSEDLKTILHE